MTTFVHSLKVLKKIKETPDTWSFQFEVTKDLEKIFSYKPGQYVTFFMNINGNDIRRSYSICTNPEEDKNFIVTVKRVKNGVGSNYLTTQVQEGDVLQLTPPTGNFFKDKSNAPIDNYVFAVAGSGVTPAMSILRFVLQQKPSSKILFIFQNRNEEQIIYKKPLESLAKKFGDRMNLVHVLSQPTKNWKGLSGRITQEQLEALFAQQPHLTSKGTNFYTCGPEPFMDTFTNFLTNKNIDEKFIHRESFTPAGLNKKEHTVPQNVSKNIFIGDIPKPFETPETIEVLMDDESHTVPATPGMGITEALIQAGLNPPYSCLEGDCMSCMAKILEGRVGQKDPGILTEEDLEENVILTCQAIPLSKKIKIDFGDL